MPFTDGQTILETIEPVDGGGFQLYIVFINAEQTDKKRRLVAIAPNTSTENVKAAIRTVRDGLDASSDALKFLVPGTLDLTPIPPSVSVPTPQQVFLSLWAQYQSALRKVQAGIVDVGVKEVSDLQVLVVAAYKPEFVGIG